MAPTLPTEQVYSGGDFAGVAVLVAFSMLSLISVLGVFIVLGASLMQGRRDKTVFVRTQIAKFLSSLLLCNIVQAVGGLLNIAWLVENRIYVGVTCTAQGALKQIGNSGPAIFTFVIAVQTFCLLFLRREWSDRTCHIIHIVSWASLLFQLCIEHFVYADPEKEKGPYYGITTNGYWCWISPKYQIERYITDYLLMMTSAAFSFILYSLVFFRLRGNIIVTGYKISFHRRPDIRIGRASNGALVVTDDRRVESYLDTVAKHMLLYPIVYIFLILPLAATRYPAFRGEQVPFEATMFAAAVFMLHGFFNTVLFCTTRNILPGSWKQRLGLGTTFDSGRGDTGRSNATSAMCRGTLGSIATVGTRPSLAVLNTTAEDVGIMETTEGSSSFVWSGSPSSSTSPTLPTPLFQAHGGSGQRSSAHEHHIRIPPPVRQDTRTSTRSDRDKDDNLSVGVRLASMATTVEWVAPQNPGRASNHHKGGVYGPDRV